MWALPHTSPWGSEAGTLREQLNSITEYVSNGYCFHWYWENMVFCPHMETMKKHSRLNGDLSKLTLIQIDAHADLRDELNARDSPMELQYGGLLTGVEG